MVLCAYYAIRSEKQIAHLNTPTLLAENRTACTATSSPSRTRSSRTSGSQRLLFEYNLALVYIYAPIAKQTVSTSYYSQHIGGSRAPISPLTHHTHLSPLPARSARPSQLCYNLYTHVRTSSSCSCEKIAQRTPQRELRPVVSTHTSHAHTQTPPRTTQQPRRVHTPDQAHLRCLLPEPLLRTMDAPRSPCPREKRPSSGDM